MVFAGCASVDFDYPKEVSFAVDPEQPSALAARIAPEVDANPGLSGFYPLPDAVDALAGRMAMASRAEHTLDAQYHLIKSDVVGHVFLQSLLDAADRGVRVRLLVDDIETKGKDGKLVGLDSHPNIEVRVFNPFARRSARTLDGLLDYSRVNRRMHNKTFIADNQVVLIGGRNIAAEYFGACVNHKFGDLDVMAIGPLVQEASAMFDLYWNHEIAVPLAGFIRMPADPAVELEALRVRIQQSEAEIADTPYRSGLNDGYGYLKNAGYGMFHWAPYQLAYDSPDKGYKQLADEAKSIRTKLKASVYGSETELVIISPYFVPRKRGIEWLCSMKASGIDITIVTNSLASTNQILVHGGYKSARKPLLEAGIKLYEVRPDADVRGSEAVSMDDTRATLHTKVFVVDRREMFIGSFNFDPRSAYINTESGVIIESPEMIEPMVERMYRVMPDQVYELFLSERGKLRWRTFQEGEEYIFDREPETSWWHRRKAGFYGLLPIRSQL